MGTYYYLHNQTQNVAVHLDHYVKQGPMRFNVAVAQALINYMMDNPGDKMTIVDDNQLDSGTPQLDLLNYPLDIDVRKSIADYMILLYQDDDNKEKWRNWAKRMTPPRS